ncbi:hypothetical protein JCM8097_005366 [Rhodosporidiobolus ruineniae]
MLLPFALLPLLPLISALAIPTTPPSVHLHARQSPSSCNASLVSPPQVGGNGSVGAFNTSSGQQVVAVAIARGTANYTCTFSNFVDSGILAVLYDVTCLGVLESVANATASNATSSGSSVASSTVTGSATTQDSGSLLTAATATTPTAAALLPIDDPSAQPQLPPLPLLPNPTLQPSNFTLSLLPLLAIQVPFPYNASTFPYLGGGGVLGEHYYVSAASVNASDGDEGGNLPFYSLPGYGAFAAQETSTLPSPPVNVTLVGGNVTAPPLDWATYETVNGGTGAFATSVWRVETAGGGLNGTACSTEGNTTTVDFAALYYFFR